MDSKVRKHLDRVLSHLYINPLEKCNLKCKICYTRKASPILKEKEILEFVVRYEKAKKLQTITFCGGEVFALPYFPKLVNKLVRGVLFSDSHLAVTGKFIQIITNGTIDRLSEFENPNFVNLIVSLDGLKTYHDANRGAGNFKKSIGFLKKALSLGFHTEIFSIVTHQNFSQIDEFEEYIYSVINDSSTVGGVMASQVQPATPEVSLRLPITYHPRKPPAYLLHHPESNVFGKVAGFDFLNDSEMITIMKERRTFPPYELGCYQIALVSDGRVFGCCEGTIPLGKMTDDINYLFDKLKERIEIWERTNPPAGRLKNCLGCSQPDFVCGIKRYLQFFNLRVLPPRHPSVAPG